MGRCKTILIVTLCLLVLAYFCFYEPCADPDYGKYSKQIEKLQMQNDSLKGMNWKLDNQVFRLKSQTDSIMKLVTIDRQAINKLKKTESERIQAIDNYNNNELFRFFAALKAYSTESQ